jgi:hypothetical protein
MLYSEIIAVCSQIHTKHTNTLCGQNVFLAKNFKIRIYRTIILPVVLYGCETWSLTLREERRLSVFENRALRGIFGLKGRGNRGVEKTT